MVTRSDDQLDAFGWERLTGWSDSRLQCVRLPVRLRYTPGLAIGVLALAVFALEVRFILQSHLSDLLSSRMQDDAFYYLQPAWMFRTTGHFSFDGISPTYGFQPLWMVLLALLALTGISKLAFLRAALVLSTLLYGATGLLLHRLSLRWTSGWYSFLAPVIWLVNPKLMGIYTSGMENSLQAFLLVAALIVVYRVSESGGQRRVHEYLSCGLVLGLLTLARVNAMIIVVLLTCCVLLSSRNAVRARVGALLVVGALAVILPWLVYARAEFGTVFPTSGTVKLLEGKIGVVTYLAEKLPAMPRSSFGRLLTVEERAVFKSGVPVDQPSLNGTARYLVQTTPSFVIGSWTDRVTSRPVTAVGRLARLAQLVSLAVLVLLALSTVSSWMKDGLGKGIRGGVSASHHLPLVALGTYGIVNALLNSFLLTKYVSYGTWYAVPETLLWVLAVSIVPLLAGEAFKIRKGLTKTRWAHVLFAGSSATMLVLGVFSIYQSTRPIAYPDHPDNAYMTEALSGSRWLNANLHKGERVASWSAGVLGYFTTGPVVVNVDGLAASPGFVNTVLRQSYFYSHAPGSVHVGENPLWSWLKQQRIQYIADAEVADSLNRRPFFGIVPVGHYTVVYRNPNPIDVGDGRVRNFVVIELKY